MRLEFWGRHSIILLNDTVGRHSHLSWKHIRIGRYFATTASGETGKTYRHARHGSHTTHLDALHKFPLEIAHLGLTTGTRAPTFALVGTFGDFQRNAVLLSNGAADLL